MSEPGEAPVKFLQAFFVKVAGEESGKRTIIAAASSETIDRDGEIILASAIKAAMPEFMKNPVILAAHSHRLDSGNSPVVGKVIRFWGEGKKTLIEVEFADTSLGLEYYNLYQGKFQKAFSIGFRSLKGERRLIDSKDVYVHTAIELFEISAVAVPANPDALSKAAKRSSFVNGKKLDREKRRIVEDEDVYTDLLERWGEAKDTEDDLENSGFFKNLSDAEKAVLTDLEKAADDFGNYFLDEAGDDEGPENYEKAVLGEAGSPDDVLTDEPDYEGLL
jgi:HK97 family phage prohead protease